MYEPTRFCALSVHFLGGPTLAMTRTMRIAILLGVLPFCSAVSTATAQPYPPSEVITGVTFDRATHIERAPGSDNWPVTWGDDGHQYTSWGDGGGFGGTNSAGRVSLGVGRVEGGVAAHTGHNIRGGVRPEAGGGMNGKSYGILSVGSDLYMWISPGSNTDNYARATLHRSTDHGRTWTAATWSFTQSQALILPTFAQFGRGYEGARDRFVYMYAVRLQDGSALQVQRPGRIDLIRVPSEQLMNRSAYRFFSGMDGERPTFTADIAARRPVFRDERGVGWNVSVSYNEPLGRYILCTEHDQTFRGKLGMFDAPEPWGPWTTVAYRDGFEGFNRTFFWNVANRWTNRTHGRVFRMVFTGVEGDDSWNVITGRFAVAAPPDAGMTDAGVTDAGMTDASTADAGTADAGTDAGTADAGTADAGMSDAAMSEGDADVMPDPTDDPAGCSVSRARSSPLLPLLVALFLIRRRR